ncbi:MAG: DUF2269 family protein [Chloroflexi bacterium]|nr:DUF2269 family protein [Chloroflexota bacterium]
MSLEEFLLIVHIFGAFLMVAAAGITTAAGVMSGRSNDLKQIIAWLDLQRVSELFVTTPGAVIAIVFGSWLVSEAGFEFSEAWLSAAYLLWLVAMGLDHGWFLPFNRRVRRRAAELVAAGSTDASEVKTMLAAPLAAVIGIGLDLSFIVFLFLMVVRPGS